MGNPSGNIYSSVAYLPQRASPRSSGSLCLCLTARCLQIHWPISRGFCHALSLARKWVVCPSIHTACRISILLVTGSHNLPWELVSPTPSPPQLRLGPLDGSEHKCPTFINQSLSEVPLRQAWEVMATFFTD